VAIAAPKALSIGPNLRRFLDDPLYRYAGDSRHNMAAWVGS
jgi:hypothetical protein